MSDIAFNHLAYIDKLRAAGFDERQARAHAEALDAALRERIATKADLLDVERGLKSEIIRLENKIELATRDLTIRMGAMLVVLFGALASIKYFG